MALYSDNQPMDCLNLSENYVSHWTYLQGLRELYSNFMDACIEEHPEFKLLHRKDPTPNLVIFTQSRRVGNNLEQIQSNYISYDRIKKTLILENDKTFSVKCLLMGCSEKGPEALGQFGEGMKVAMIVLLKADLNIVIESGDCTYYPTIKSWDHNPLYQNKYDRRVLYAKVQPKMAKKSTKVIIENVDSTKFEEFLYLSLALLDSSKYKKIKCGNSTLIIPFDPKLVGKVYKKGVRLELHESANSRKFQHYSYDLDTISVGRQRDCVNNVWDLYRLQSELHYNIMCKLLDNNFLCLNPDLRPKLKQHLQNIYEYLRQNNYQTHFFHEYSKSNKPLCDLIFDKFLQKHEKLEGQLYPQYEHAKYENIRQLQLYGLPQTFYNTVDVSWQMWHTLAHSTKYKSIKTLITQQILNKQIRQLTQPQREKISTIVKKIQVILPQINEYSYAIKCFKQIACCKDQNPTIKVIYLNPQLIDNTDKMTRNLCKMFL